MKSNLTCSIKNCLMMVFAMLLLSANVFSQEKTISPLLGKWDLTSVNYVIEKGGKTIAQKTYLPGQTSQIPEDYPKVILMINNHFDSYLLLLLEKSGRDKNSEYNMKGEMKITGNSLEITTDSGSNLNYTFKKDGEELQLINTSTRSDGSVIKQTSIYNKAN